MFALLAQADNTEAQTVVIDPAAAPGVEVQSPTPATPTGEEASGPVADAIKGVVPDTGVESVDSAVGTLSQAIGDMLDTFIRHLPQMVIALIVIIVTAFAASFAKKLMHGITKRVRLSTSLRDLFGQFAYIGVWFVGLMIAAGIVFPGFGFGQLVATAGLASIAIGFAFQDIFENFFAGILILWKFPFDKGDYIEVPSESVEGQVEDIEIRMTKIRQVTGELVLVPNATIYKNVVHVLTNRNTRRVTVMCGIAYGEDVAEGRAVMRKAVESCDTVDKDQPIQIFAQAFGASSIDFEVTWWTGPTPLDRRKSRDQVVEAVKRELDAAGIEIPYPYRTLTFTQNEPDIIKAVAGRARDDGNGDGDRGDD